jgi:hypothetical protein
MRRVSVIALAVASTAVLLRAGCACSGSHENPSADASTDAGPDVKITWPDHISSEAIAGDGSPIPAGWVPFNDYDPSCGFYVPTSKSVLPPPIQWAPCDPSYEQPPTIACRQMVVDWTPPVAGQPGGVTTLTPAWIDPTGRYFVGLGRSEGPLVYFLVAEADGPVHSAFIATYGAPCVANLEEVRDGRVVYQIFDSEAKGTVSSYGGGALVANIDDLAPRVFLHYHDQKSRGYSVGLPGVLETLADPVNEMILHDWSNGSIEQVILTSGMDNGLQLVPTAFFGNSLFFEASTLPISKVQIWDADAGVRDFISYGNDTTQGVADLWTDGHDMVWEYGSGRTNPNSVYPAVSYMTSPYTTQGNQVQARRLRSETGYGFGTGLTQVGCGYAARSIPSGIRVVRLSDGVSWILPAQQNSTWQWLEPLAITCTEVFAMATTVGDAGVSIGTFARVALNSLGPGIPPD